MAESFDDLDDEDDGILLDIEPDLEVQIRLQVLHNVVHELAQGFGVFETATFEVIRKAIVERQVLQELIILYLNVKGEKEGKITISIDWDKHVVLANSDDGKNFSVNPKKSIIEQISQAYPIIVEHTRKFRKAHAIAKIVVQFRYTKEVMADKAKFKAISTFLGTHPTTEPQWALGPFNPDPPDFEIDYTSRNMQELQIKWEINKPRPNQHS